MRVVAGRARGTALTAPPDGRTRPTADRIKEDLFNIIARNAAGASFLDMYSGTGQIGIEALSRGAARAVFVESDRRSAELIRKNIAKCRLDFATVICDDALRALGRPSLTGQPFDIVFLDPPYDTEELPEILAALTGGGLLRDGALVICEQAVKAPPVDIPGLHVYRLKEYSTTKLTFMEYIAVPIENRLRASSEIALKPAIPTRSQSFSKRNNYICTKHQEDSIDGNLLRQL